MTAGEFQEFMITVGYRYNEKSKSAFNTFEGFHAIINFNEDESRYALRMSAGTAENTNVKEVNEILHKFASENKTFITHAVYKNKKVQMNIKMTVDSDVDKERLKATAKFITELCRSGKLVPICRICSRPQKTGLYVVGRELAAICEPCVAKKRRQYEHRRDMFIKKKQNMPAGIFGAIFGAVLGSLIYILLYQFITMYGAGSIFIAVLSFTGFVVCGKRATRKSAVICEIISAVSFAAAEYLSLVAAMAIEIERLSGGIAVSESLRATNMSFLEQSYVKSILIEFGIGIAVMIVTGILYFLKRKYTRPLKISKNIL